MSIVGERVIRNVRINGFPNGQPDYAAMHQSEIDAEVSSTMKGWPRRFGVKLFAATPPKELPPLGNLAHLRMFLTPDDLFAWFHETCKVEWKNDTLTFTKEEGSQSTVSRSQFFSHLCATATPTYQAIERFPHLPPRLNHFYLPHELPKADGTALKEYIDHLNPDTDADADLLVAALMTPGWGGPPGSRPAFVIRSDHGRGVGKSSTAELICDIWGTALELNDKDSFRTIRAALMNDHRTGLRCIRIDNLTAKLENSGLAGLITAKRVAGHILYKGQGDYPNNLTVFITANTPRLSLDLIDRCVPIHIGPKQKAPQWQIWVEKFVRKRRPALIADIMQKIGQGGKLIPIDAGDSRWAAWEEAILSRFQNGQSLVTLIATRKATLVAQSGGGITKKMEFPDA